MEMGALLHKNYSTLQLNEVRNQGFTNQIILRPASSKNCLLPPASKPVTLYLMQKKTAVFTDGSDPFEADTSNSQYRRQKVEELEL